MSAPVMPSLRVLTVTLTNANTAYQLTALINTADSQYLAKQIQANFLAIQFDPDAAIGGKKLRIGNQDLTTVNGNVIFSTGSWPQQPFNFASQLVNLAEIWLMSDQAGATAAVSFLKQ